MNQIGFEVKLKRLGYTQAWVDLGVVTPTIIETQFNEICSSEDHHAEHYRHRAYLNFLQNKSALTDNEINQLFQLVDDGPDGIDLSLQRKRTLLDFNRLLTDAQLTRLSVEYQEFSKQPIEKAYRSITLLRNIAANGLTEDLFEDVKKHQDPDVERHILSKQLVTKAHIKWLQEFGSNKKIRNMAKQMANQNVFRHTGA